MAELLREDVAWQKTPLPLTETDYIGFIRYGLKHLYIDTGRAAMYNDSLFADQAQTELNTALPIDEEEYVLLLARIAFFKRVQTDVNNIVSYSTDALTVTNAHRPYANLQDTLSGLENERRILFYKMARYSLL